MKRRALLSGALTLPFAAACKPQRKVVRGSYGGVDVLELVPSAPDDALPTLVAIHGNGGAPEHWVDGFVTFPGRARVVLPRGFERQDTGFRWFARADLASAELATAVAAAEERLAKGIAALGGRVAVTGYAEGAMLALVLARRTELVLGAFSVAGACPRALYPTSRAAPVAAYHGSVDDLFPLTAARESIAAFQKAGGSATLREYPGVGHNPSDAMHVDLDRDIVRALDAARSPGR